jgi:hypothetical protein
MSNSFTEFHKIWIEQCAATEGIRERFGWESALDYLIGEKIFSFVMASERDPDFAAELPAFIAEIRRLFTAQEIHPYLDSLARLSHI